MSYQSTVHSRLVHRGSTLIIARTKEDSKSPHTQSDRENRRSNDASEAASQSRKNRPQNSH